MSRLLLSLAAGVTLLSAADLIAHNPDDTAIRQTIQYYFDGGRTGDSATLRKAFHPDARMLFAREGALAVVPIGDYIKRVAENRPRPGAVDSTERRIASIDIAGDAAVAKLEQKRPDMIVTDYMSLIRVGERWLIVNKIFSRTAVQREAAGR
jgi:hypothetical protein